MTHAVSVVMTVNHEPRTRLVRCLRAVAAQRTSAALEVVVAAPPGDTEVESAIAQAELSSARIVPNSTGRRSEGLNRAIRASTGTFVCRVDARSRIPTDYVDRCVQRLLLDPSIGVVGAFQRPVAEAGGAVAAGIARALRNPYLLGAPRYRRCEGGGPVDTVYLGTWRKVDLEALGGFDERLDANEDYELCRRFARAGRVVWLEEDLEVTYESRTGFGEVFGQYHAFGRSKVRYWRTMREPPNGRQAAALVFGGSACLVALSASARPRRLFAMAIATGTVLLVLDDVAGPRDARVPVRVAAAMASTCVVGGWISGVAREAALPTRL